MARGESANRAITGGSRGGMKMKGRWQRNKIKNLEKANEWGSDKVPGIGKTKKLVVQAN